MSESERPSVPEIRARLEAATPGPWHWSGNTDANRIYLATWIRGYGRCTVMDFTRWGMQSARPRFAEDMMMVDADKRVSYVVAHGAKSRLDPRVYRADIDAINHPDAALIAHAPTDIAFLLERLDAVRKYVDDPGNWSALDGRRQVLLDLIEGGSDV